MIGKLIVWFENHRKLSILVVIVSLAIVLYPRFNRHDIAIIRPFVGLQQGEISPDGRNYVNFTQYFKHRMPLDSVGAPFSYRPMIPFLASLLPVDSLLGINLIDTIALYLTLICIFFTLKKYRFEFGYCIAGCLLFIFSFPVFYYGASTGIIDAPAVFMISLIVMATVYKKYITLPMLFLIGSSVKEAVVVTFPFIIAYAYLTENRTKREEIFHWGFIVLSMVLFVVGYLYCRAAFSTVKNFLWSPTLTTLGENAIRPKAYLSFILTFGVVGILAWLQFRHDLKKNSSSLKSTALRFLKTYQYTPLLAGTLAGLFLWFYTLVGAYVDGRYFWIAYPFMIPLAVKYFQERHFLAEKGIADITS